MWIQTETPHSGRGYSQSQYPRVPGSPPALWLAIAAGAADTVTSTRPAPTTPAEAVARVWNKDEPHIAMASQTRITDAWHAVKATAAAGLVGDIVECG